MKYESSNEENTVPSLLENIFKVSKESGHQLSETDNLQTVQITNVLFGHSCHRQCHPTDGNSCFQNRIAIITSVVR